MKTILEELPNGHKERFMTKLQVADNEIVMAKQSEKASRVRLYWLIPAACVAVVLVGLFIIKGNRIITDARHDFNPQLLEAQYIEQLSALSASIPEEFAVSDGSLKKDAIEFGKTLPAELSDKEKYRLVKEYYEQKIAGLKKFKTYIAEVEY